MGAERDIQACSPQFFDEPGWHTELDLRALTLGARVTVEAHVEAVRRWP